MADNRTGKLYEEIAAQMMEQSRSGALRPALLERRWDRDRAKLEGLGRLLGSLDPRALLSRGYAMVRDGEGAIVELEER